MQVLVTSAQRGSLRSSQVFGLSPQERNQAFEFEHAHTKSLSGNAAAQGKVEVQTILPLTCLEAATDDLIGSQQRVR
jgi:hypothetical protein